MGSETMKEELHCSSSSSGDEDGDEEWKAAINSAASTFPGCSQPNPTPTPASDDDDEDVKLQPQPIKHYQIKVISPSLATIVMLSPIYSTFMEFNFASC